MEMQTTTLPGNFHRAVEDWRDLYLPDYNLLMENWERFFPREPRFKLCAFRAVGMCSRIECGDDEGKPKYNHASDMKAEKAGKVLAAIRAQASTEFGSIQQHQLTLSRAQTEQDQFWILRMMAEELRHGYQMFHVLLDDDWSSVSDASGADMVEEVLEMRTGSHILGAFNVDFDSFVDNIVFCCLIDRVGKYQLSMQKISAYQPMADSMPRMLQEEAFHLATGMVPLRRWVKEAAEGSVYVPMSLIQKTFNKWLPRGLEMFGDERGGGTNVKYGFKPMTNEEAQTRYYKECCKGAADLNVRYVRARLPKLTADETGKLIRDVMENGRTVHGISSDDLLRMPHRNFYRRRGIAAFAMYGVHGEEFHTFDEYVRHLLDSLPETTRAGSDFKRHVELQRRVAAGEMTADEAARQSPTLRRVGGVCPCSRAVRWVKDDAAPAAEATAS